MTQDQAWTVESVAAAIGPVLTDLGWPHHDLRLLRHGENITFDAVGTPFVARVARPYADPAAIDTEVGCARFLEAEGFPAGRLFGDIDQPVKTPVGLVTFWRRIDGRKGTDADLPVLGRMLSELHAKVPPGWLRRWEPLRKVPARLAEIDRQQVLPDDDLRFLHSLATQLDEEVAAFSGTPVAARSMCHGDAHSGNLLVTSAGGVLVDWEDSSVGPPEWDLGETLMARRRFGLSADLLDSFAVAYGRDLFGTETADLMARIRELTATSWLLQNGQASAAVVAEGQLRIRTLRDPSDTATWSAF